jgi:DNA-binding transcriptional MocR family regulator
MTAPQGGFLLWVEMPDSSVDALELQRRALRARISIAPGPIFSVRGEFEHCSRLNCDYRWTDEIEQAMATLRRLSRP